MTVSLKRFRRAVWIYYRAHRRAMPWRPPALRVRADGTADPYKVMVSEIMLQQTQVDRVREKYPQFLRAFPDFRSLADASARDVLRTWSGLGYNRRALFLKRSACKALKEYNGTLPRDPEALAAFPGIGRATARSLCAFAFNMPVAFIETNIRRVFIHYFFKNKKQVHDADILPLVAKTCNTRNPREWYYALMDMGAALAKQTENPNRNSAHYARQSRFEGSDRQKRGAVLRLFRDKQRVRLDRVPSLIAVTRTRAMRVLRSLERDGLVAVGETFVRLGKL